MTPADLDLTEAVDAAARARYERVRRDRDQARLGEMPAWHDLAPQHQHGWREGVLNEVAAAAPLIERAVRERVAADIEAEVDMADHAYVRTGMRTAARIAREAVR